MNKWVKKDLEYIWHPYTQMKDCLSLPPILIEKAKGSKLYDDKGNFYYDTISSWWCNVHGHNHPAINKAVREQLKSLEHVLFAGFTHRPAISLAEELIRCSPDGLEKVFFSDNGSTAIETALKMSLQYWRNTGKKRKTVFLSLDRGYHGDTAGAMSVSGINIFNSKFKDLFFPSFKAPSPYCYRCPLGLEMSDCGMRCLEPLEEALKKNHDRIAAMVLEPLVMAAAGMIIYPKEYLRGAADLAARYGVHLILDEVATGFGRTGRMFACEHAQVKPDFLCLSKGLTAGYLAMGATLTTEKIYRAFYAGHERQKTFYHGHTFTANPIAASAALASLRIFREGAVLERLKKIMPFFHEGMDRFKSLDIAGDVRYIGLIGAVELVKDRKMKTPFGFKERIGLDIYKEGLKRHLVLRPLGNVIYLWLPLSIKRGELSYILDATFEILEKRA